MSFKALSTDNNKNKVRVMSKRATFIKGVPVKAYFKVGEPAFVITANEKRIPVKIINRMWDPAGHEIAYKVEVPSNSVYSDRWVNQKHLKKKHYPAVGFFQQYPNLIAQ